MSAQAYMFSVLLSKRKWGMLTCADALDGNGPWSLLMRRRDLLAGIEGGVEKGVDECRFAKTGFTCVRE